MPSRIQQKMMHSFLKNVDGRIKMQQFLGGNKKKNEEEKVLTKVN